MNSPIPRTRSALFMVLALAPLITSSTPARAQNLPATPPLAPSVSLLSDDALRDFTLLGSEVGKGRINIVSADQPTFKTVIRAQTIEAIEVPYHLQLTARTTGPIKKDDVLFASFWARAVESTAGEAFLGFTFEQSTPPYQKSLWVESSVGKEWKQFNFPFKAVESYAAGEANFNLRLGYQPQTVEIGGLTLRNYATRITVQSLPFTSQTYAGHEPDAPWREAAQERIEKIRKANLRVTVRDRNGIAVRGAQIKIEQTRLAFGIGSAVTAKALLSSDPAEREYQQKVKLFNKVVLENDLKWTQWENDRESPQRAVKLLNDQGIEVRGHNLVWPSWQYLPSDLEKLKNNPAALQKRIADHITDEVGALKGQLPEWDVINEPYTNHDVMDITGPQVQVDWYNLAHQIDPKAKLYLNDYNIFEGGGNDVKHQKHFEETIAYLLDHKAPLGGLGIQGHFGASLTSPEKMLQVLDRFSQFKLPIQITEFDFDTTDEKLQADFTRDLMITMFSHPSVNGVLMWGFWEGRHWRPNAALWRKHWTLKPNGQAWLDLTQKEWRTNAVGLTDAQGNLNQRAFLGDYEISATVNGQTVTKKVSLEMAGKTENVILALRL